MTAVVMTCVNSTGCVSVTEPCTGAGAGNCSVNKCFAKTCVGNVCVPGTPVNCNDNNACTSERCDPLAPGQRLHLHQLLLSADVLVRLHGVRARQHGPARLPARPRRQL